MGQLQQHSQFGLENHGLNNGASIHWNLGPEALYEATIREGSGMVSQGGALVVETGAYTGRSSNDKFIIEEETSRDDIWWGAVNKGNTEDRFNMLRLQMLAYLQRREIFVQDLVVGADPSFQLKVRVISESPWHSLFARNMFRQPSVKEREKFVPELTIVNTPYYKTDGERDGVNSECAIMMNFKERMVLITGTQYAGEIKKSVFSYLNYVLPDRNVLPMHCSANIGDKGDVGIFFGLSGTGKTTLSADGTRTLIGDDEHGWTDTGVFNFEGGCYAKVINLSAKAEPEIYKTCSMFGTILENVVMDPDTRVLDLDNKSLTENTRASYPLSFIPNVEMSGVGGQPENVVMLTADAFGVMPPISRLSADQAMYHFLSGYTAVVGGTERGLTEPKATFSTCFGAAFMPRHPAVYAKMLGERIAKTGAKCWLVNTGWSGGAYGTGKRMDIAYTRAMVRAALDGRLAEVAMSADPNFGLNIPQNCPDVPNEVLQPRETWGDKSAYDSAARDLTQRFEANFKQFEEYVDANVKAAGVYAA